MRGAGIAERIAGGRVVTALRARPAHAEFVDEISARTGFLVQPVAQVVPFDVDIEYPVEVDGVPMTTYLDWMASCWQITVLGGPAISVPCGFTREGLPVGLQILGPREGEEIVLRLALAYEQAHDWHTRHPKL